MIFDILAIFDNKVLQSAGWPAGTSVSQFSYDTFIPGGVGVQGNNSAVAGSGGGGAGVSASPAPLGPPGTLAGIGAPLLHDIGRGRPIFLYSQTGVAASTGGTSVQENFISATNGTLTAGVIVILQTPVVPLATLTLGYRFPWKTLPGKVTQQFIGMQYVAVGAFTGLANFTTAMAFFVDDHADILGGAP